MVGVEEYGGREGFDVVFADDGAGLVGADGVGEAELLDELLALIGTESRPSCWIATKATSSLCAWKAASKWGISSRHGGHEGYQKLSTTGLPSKVFRLMGWSFSKFSLPNASKLKDAATSALPSSDESPSPPQAAARMMRIVAATSQCSVFMVVPSHMLLWYWMQGAEGKMRESRRLIARKISVEVVIATSCSNQFIPHYGSGFITIQLYKISCH